VERVKINHRGIAELLKGSAAEKACRPEAEKALERAKAAAPVVSGDYQRSLHIEEVEHPTRKVWRVVADVAYAMKVEADHGTLGRSL
jgi:hypothetical protein